MSRSDNTDWHRKRGDSNRPSWRNAVDWCAWHTEYGNHPNKYAWKDFSFPAGHGQEARRYFWKAQRSAVKIMLRCMDPLLDDDPAPVRTRSTIKYEYW